MSVRFLAAGTALAALVSVSSAAAQTPTPPVESPRDQNAATRLVQGFNIVLVLGETQAGSRVEATEDLPAGAQKALTDMREFLPYKHYRVLDAQWTSCCASVNSVLSGQLRGLAPSRGGSEFVDRQYGFNLTVANSSQGLSVRFALSDKAAVTPRASDNEQARGIMLQVERAELQDQIATMDLQVKEAEKKVAVGVLSAIDLRHLQDKQASLKRQLDALGRATDGLPTPPRGSIIDSSFIMQPGETVVVGTSRLGGDKAIIALVTAARKPGASR